MEIPINTEATYKLFTILSVLYEFYDSNGIPQGRKTYSLVDRRLSNLLDILQNDEKTKAFLANPQSLEITKMLFQKFIKFQSIDALLSVLNSIGNDSISTLRNSINLNYSIERLH